MMSNPSPTDNSLLVQRQDLLRLELHLPRQLKDYTALDKFALAHDSLSWRSSSTNLPPCNPSVPGVGVGVGIGVGVGVGEGQESVRTFVRSQLLGAVRPQLVSLKPFAGLYGAITAEESLHGELKCPKPNV